MGKEVFGGRAVCWVVHKRRPDKIGNLRSAFGVHFKGTRQNRLDDIRMRRRWRAGFERSRLKVEPIARSLAFLNDRFQGQRPQELNALH